MIETIIFDLGNVLVDFNHTIAAKRIACFCNKSTQEIFDLFFYSGITVLFEEGKISPQEFFLKVKELLGLNLSYDTFVPIWNEIFFLSPKNCAVYNLVNMLRAHYKMVLVSNINILHYEYLKKHFPVFGVFDRVFTSFELGVAKPDPAIYQDMLKTLNVLPESTFYTDDRKELVESAKKLGIKGFVFTDAKQLKQDLISSGVVID